MAKKEYKGKWSVGTVNPDTKSTIRVAVAIVVYILMFIGIVVLFNI